jgi:hypothetical protein
MPALFPEAPFATGSGRRAGPSDSVSWGRMCRADSRTERGALFSEAPNSAGGSVPPVLWRTSPRHWMTCKRPPPARFSRAAGPDGTRDRYSYTLDGRRPAAPPVPPFSIVGRVVNVACLAPEQPFFGETQLEGADKNIVPPTKRVLMREQRRRQGRTQPPTSRKKYVHLCACPGTCRMCGTGRGTTWVSDATAPRRARAAVSVMVADRGRF